MREVCVKGLCCSKKDIKIYINIFTILLTQIYFYYTSVCNQISSKWLHILDLKIGKFIFFSFILCLSCYKLQAYELCLSLCWDIDRLLKDCFSNYRGLVYLPVSRA